MLERRRYVRVPKDSQLSYEAIPERKVAKYLSRDISQGGVRFFVHEFVPKDSLLRVKLTLEQVPFYFEAVVKVRWVREDTRNERYEIGAEFINIPQKVTKYLANHVKAVLKKI